jgi:hypothetical protein
MTTSQLKSAFSKFNHQYFDGELQEVEIKLSRTKRALGMFKWRTDWCGRLSMWIEISTYYNRPIRDVYNTLIHEMIHLWQKQNGYEMGHGYHFNKKAAEINADGWFISRCNNANGEVCESIASNKTYNVFAFKSEERYFMFVATPSKVISMMDYLKCYKSEVIYFQTNDYKRFDRMTQCRSRLRGKYITKEEYNKLFEQYNVRCLKSA